MKFQVKIYDFQDKFIGVIPDDEMLSQISTTATINAVPRGFGILINDKFERDNPKLRAMNRVRVYAFPDKGSDGFLIFNGFISEVKRNLRTNGEFIDLEVLHVGATLNYSLFKSGGSTTFTLSGKASELITDVMSDFQANYSNFLELGNIEDSISDISLDFNDQKWLQAIQTIVTLAPEFYWRVQRDGVLDLFREATDVQHRLTVGKDIVEINHTEDADKIVNYVLVRWKSGVETIEDLDSQSEFGIRVPSSGIIDDNEIGSADSAIERGNNELRAIPVKTTRVRVSNAYPIETIKVGDTCRIQNIDIDQSFLPNVMIISSVNYSRDGCTIELGEKSDEVAVALK